MASVKEDRLAVRMSARQKRTIERAAKSSGRTLTEFSVEALTERAEEVLSQRPLFVADAEQWAEFMRILDEPARPVPELVELFRRPTVFEE